MSLYDNVKDRIPWEPLPGGSFHKMYILVRGDLSKSQQAVQACHAVAQCILEGKHQDIPQEGDMYYGHAWRNGAIVLLKVKDHVDILCWRENLMAKGYAVAEFQEPDIGNQTTALAVTGDGLQDIFIGVPLI